MYQAKTTWPTPWGFYLIVLFGVTLDVAYESQNLGFCFELWD